MMKNYRYFWGLILSAMMISCSEEALDLPVLTPEQEALIGRAVNFSASIADDFSTRASSYTDILDGKFNQNDLMRIYRNYYEDGAWSQTEVYRTYRYRYESDATTGIDLGKDWQVEKDRKGFDDKGDGYKEFTQTETDSLTWDNGKTLRFRAWSLSNYHNVIEGASRSYFYPDYCIASYVNASGPSTSIPLVLKHQGTRFWFRVKESGNSFAGIRFCAYMNPDGTENADGWKDYLYKDNADVESNDNLEIEPNKTEAQAKAECEAVTAVFKRMCMPAGVDIQSGTLKAVRKSFWNGLTDNNADLIKVRHLEEQSEENFIKYNTLSSAEIAEQAKRPFFSIINGYPLMITIPYDISSDADKLGEVLTLPACTRFRVYLRDVNGGDEFNTSNYEGKYHILALSDIKNSDGTPAFPDGLKLGAGKSYSFNVGYRYGGLYVVLDNNLSWTEQDLAEQEAADAAASQPVSTASDYSWWKTAIHTAIPTGTEDFRPEFHITSEQDFLEFIHLVNGTATTKTSGLYRLDRTVQQDGKTVTIKDWSTESNIYKAHWVTEAEMEAQGYIFYDHYHAANADKAAYSDRDYLTGHYPFYDENLQRNFTVKLDNDLDLKDWSVESIGKLATTPFSGCFDGQGHTIRNLNMREEYLFGYMNGIGTEHASITNLKIESTHKTGLLNTGINPIYIAGISLIAPTTTNSIAKSLSMETGVSGTSYVVGCIHIGDAGGALVGKASNVNMFGCMQAAGGINGGALIGEDKNSPAVFKPQISLSGQKSGAYINAKPSFRNFMCNYYDAELSSGAHAVGNVADDYSLLEYIRGSNTDILRARNDYLTSKVTMAQLLKLSNYQIYYGLAPWRAMNYAIYWYNTNRGDKHPCTMHFENNSTGYSHRYPVLMNVDPETKYTKPVVVGWNPIEQTN